MLAQTPHSSAADTQRSRGTERENDGLPPITVRPPGHATQGACLAREGLGSGEEPRYDPGPSAFMEGPFYSGASRKRLDELMDAVALSKG